MRVAKRRIHAADQSIGNSRGTRTNSQGGLVDTRRCHEIEHDEPVDATHQY